jgi:DNA-binding transcriptional MocR family regulator
MGLPPFGMPGGGFYMWCELAAHIDDKQLSRMAAEQSILLAPGSAFNPDGTAARPAMRVNIAHVGDPRFAQFIAQASAAPP